MFPWFNTPHGRLSPERIKNLFQVGYTKFNDNNKHYSLIFTRYWPCLMTNQVLVNMINLYVVEEMEIKSGVIVKALLTSQVNYVLFNSYAEIVQGCNIASIDSLMLPTVVQLVNNDANFEIEENKKYIY